MEIKIIYQNKQLKKTIFDLTINRDTANYILPKIGESIRLSNNKDKPISYIITNTVHDTHVKEYEDSGGSKDNELYSFTEVSLTIWVYCVPSE